MQKAAKIDVTLHYPLEKIYVLHKISQKEYGKTDFILFNTRLIWFTWSLGISKIWEIVENQTDPKENVGLIN